jgi:hypothetical protein
MHASEHQQTMTRRQLFAHRHDLVLLVWWASPARFSAVYIVTVLHHHPLLLTKKNATALSSISVRRQHQTSRIHPCLSSSSNVQQHHCFTMGC